MTKDGDVTAVVAEIPQSVIREIHHQVKNTLQVVCSLLRLEGRDATDPGAKQLVRRSEGRVQAMALVYDTLYRTGSSMEVTLDRYIPSLVQQVVRGWQRAGRSLRVDCSVEPLSISMKATISCGLILNEILCECGSAADGTYLRVDVRANGGGVRMDVEMDHVGTRGGNKPLLSTKIVQALVQQYGGRVETQGGEVVRYRIELPSIHD